MLFGCWGVRDDGMGLQLGHLRIWDVSCYLAVLCLQCIINQSLVQLQSHCKLHGSTTKYLQLLTVLETSGWLLERIDLGFLGCGLFQLATTKRPKGHDPLVPSKSWGYLRYKHPIFIYIPKHGELRGGAWVVIDPAINPEKMEM